MRVRHKEFKSSFKSWESLCDGAAEFATSLGRERLLSISTALGDTGGQGVVFAQTS